MSRLVIEYVLEGHQRGYNFTSPTYHYDDATLKIIWRNAMPRGQGWSAALYSNARSIKCFPLDTGEVAVSEVTVTDQEDENGRRGIRRAVVDTMWPNVFAHHLQSRLNGYPADVRAKVREKVEHVRRSFPRLKKDTPLILAYPFATPCTWWLVEALVLQLALNPLRPMRRWGPVITFTTLALSYHNESRIVALPVQEAAQVTDAPVVGV